jgi:signal transduction histidine kinase/CheY-like chemotaxis protein
MAEGDSLGRRPFLSAAALAACFLLLLISALTSITAFERRLAQSEGVRESMAIQTRLADLLSMMQDAETGQRGYLLTGDPIYLTPFDRGVADAPRQVDALIVAMRDNASQRANLEELDILIDAKLAELGETVTLRRNNRGPDALRLVRSNHGKATMDRIRDLIDRIRSSERILQDIRSRAADKSAAETRISIIVLTALITLLAGLSFYIARRGLRELQTANRQLVDESARREAAEAETRHIQKMEVLGQLTGGIAHDFNNVLAVIVGGIDLARRRLSKGDANISRYLDSALEGAQHATALTSRLLAYSRRTPLQPQIVDMNRMVAGLSEVLRRSLGETIAVETVLAGGLWNVEADPSQLESVLLNLAVNARDAMPDGGKLTVETANCHLDATYATEHAEVSEGQYVLLAVSDIGVGMPPEVLARAFDPFFTTKDVGKGTGLGLSQVFGFVKQSGGHVKIYSEPGSGTTVKIYLPRSLAAGAEAQEKTETADLPLGAAHEIVLVVEDDDRVRVVSVANLRELGYTVIHASNGEAALKLLADENRTVSLLFTDVVMPGMTGRTLAETATKQRPGLKVLYTTGYTKNAVVHNGVVDAGARLLVKPFSLDALARKVREALDA